MRRVPRTSSRAAVEADIYTYMQLILDEQVVSWVSLQGIRTSYQLLHRPIMPCRCKTRCCENRYISAKVKWGHCSSSYGCVPVQRQGRGQLLDKGSLVVRPTDLRTVVVAAHILGCNASATRLSTYQAA